MSTIKLILSTLLLTFGSQTTTFAESPKKQVSIRSKFIANPSESEPDILRAYMITTFLGQEVMISVTQ